MIEIHFFAGFGNRDADEFSYLKVGIPKGKIFIINPKVLLMYIENILDKDLGCNYYDINRSYDHTPYICTGKYKYIFII